MNYTLYAAVLEKAQAALAEKSIPNARVEFKEVNVGRMQIKGFRFVTKAMRKIRRRLGR